MGVHEEDELKTYVSSRQVGLETLPRTKGSRVGSIESVGSRTEQKKTKKTKAYDFRLEIGEGELISNVWCLEHMKDF